MLIVNIASFMSGGAGTGMLRHHEAMLAAGLDSRIIVGGGGGNAASCVALSPRKPASLLRRVARRVGIQLDPAARMLGAVKQLDATAGRQPSYELFSPPLATAPLKSIRGSRKLTW